RPPNHSGTMDTSGATLSHRHGSRPDLTPSRRENAAESASTQNSWPGRGPQLPGSRCEGAMMNKPRFAGLSDRGRTHEDNEDRWLADPEFGLFLVSDGMADPVAPQLVIDLLPGLLRHVLQDMAN